MLRKPVWLSLIVALLVVAAILVAVRNRRPTEDPVPVVPHMGQIQVLNACSVSGAAWKVSEYLRKKGYDVVEYGNHDEWYFKNTIVACRNGNMEMANRVAEALHTERVLLLRQEQALLDATVFVGRDFEELLEDS